MKDNGNYLDMEVAIINTIAVKSNTIITHPKNLSRLLAFETDLFVLGDSGAAVGYEIIENAGDFKRLMLKKNIANLKKSKDYSNDVTKYYGKYAKYNYIVPVDLTERALMRLPSFCGVYSFQKGSNKTNDVLKMERKPKFIRTYKWGSADRLTITKIGCDSIGALKRELLMCKNSKKNPLL